MQVEPQKSFALCVRVTKQIESAMSKGWFAIRNQSLGGIP